MNVFTRKQDVQDKLSIITAALWFFASAVGIAMPRYVLAQSSKFASAPYGLSSYRFTSQAELDAAIARLENPTTRLQALSELADFASMKLYRVGSVYFETGDHNIDVLQQEAVDAILKHRDFKTISQALDSNDPTLQFWGVWFWGHAAYAPVHFDALTLDALTLHNAFAPPYTKENVWLRLLPKVKRLAIVGDGLVRREATEKLEIYPEARKFLWWRLAVETEPDIVMNLVDTLKHCYGNDRLSTEFNPYLLRLLNDQDLKVRQETLVFIGGNHDSAPMWQINFSQSIVAKVNEMAASGSQDEKKAAIWALEGMKKKPTQN